MSSFDEIIRSMFEEGKDAESIAKTMTDSINKVMDEQKTKKSYRQKKIDSISNHFAFESPAIDDLADLVIISKGKDLTQEEWEDLKQYVVATLDMIVEIYDKNPFKMMNNLGKTINKKEKKEKKDEDIIAEFLSIF